MTSLLLTFGLLAGVVLVIMLAPLWKLHKGVTLGIGSGIVVLSLAFYAWIGAPGIISQVDQWGLERERIEADIADLSRQLQSDTKNVGLWVRLGRQLSVIGEYGKAARAFKQAVVLTEGDPGLITLYAKALTLAAGGMVTPDAKRGFEMALTLEPENTEAQYFLGVERDQQGDKNGAKQLFTKLLRTLPDGNPLKDNVKKYLDNT